MTCKFFFTTCDTPCCYIFYSFLVAFCHKLYYFTKFLYFANLRLQPGLNRLSYCASHLNLQKLQAALKLIACLNKASTVPAMPNILVEPLYQDFDLSSPLEQFFFHPYFGCADIYLIWECQVLLITHWELKESNPGLLSREPTLLTIGAA